MSDGPVIYTDASLPEQGGVGYIAYVAKVPVGNKRILKENVKVVRSGLDSWGLELQAIVFALKDLRLNNCVILTDNKLTVDSLERVRKGQILRLLGRVKSSTQKVFLVLYLLLRSTGSRVRWRPRAVNLADRLIRVHRDRYGKGEGEKNRN